MFRNIPITLKLIFIASIVLIVIVFVAIFLLFTPQQGPQGDVQIFPSPSAGFQQPSQSPENEQSEGLRIEQNPEYLEKIKREPFWDQLPYWASNRHFKIDYKDSDNYLLITTFTTTEQLSLQYQIEARQWLEQNGANLESLTIRYQNGTFPQ